MIKKLIVVLFILAMPLVGESGSFERAPNPPDGMALVYMYRIKAPPGLRTPKIMVDGEAVSKLPNNGYTWFYLKPGTHTIRTKWGLFADIPELEFVATIDPNQTYYLKMSGSVRAWGAGTTKVYTGIKEVSESEAMADLQKAKKYAAAGADTTDSEPEAATEVATAPESTPAPRDGFAVVYIYRPDSPPIFKSPKVLVDGKETLKLSNKSYSWFYVPAGNHSVKTDWGYFGKTMVKSVTLSAESGAIYYIRAGATRSTQWNVDVYHTSLDPVDGTLAAKEIKKLKKYIPAE